MTGLWKYSTYWVCDGLFTHILINAILDNGYAYIITSDHFLLFSMSESFFHVWFLS